MFKILNCVLWLDDLDAWVNYDAQKGSFFLRKNDSTKQFSSPLTQLSK